MLKNNTVATLFLRLSFLPFCLAVVVLIGYHTIKSIYDVNTNQAKEAQRIAEMMAVVAAQRPLPGELMAKQVNALLSRSDTLASVNFYPLNQPLPHQQSKPQLFDQYLSKNAAVMLTDDGAQGAKLMGYINVTMDMRKAHRPILESAIIELIVSFVVLAVIFLILFYMFNGTSSVLRRLVEMSQHVVDGENKVSLVEHQRSKTREMRLFEDALVALSTRLQLLQDRLESTQQINQLLTKREQSLQHQKDTFQSLVTHELRTPLNAISGGLQLLETQKLDAASVDSLGLIRTGQQRLSSLLDNIITLNNLQQGHIDLVETPFNPENVLRSVAETYSQACLQKGLQLSVDIKHTAVELIADHKKVVQVLDHLLDNAIKFTEAGGVSIVSRIVHTQDDAIQWQCEVVDTGIGIDPRLHKDIFTAYVQADSGHSRQFEGSGLGLALAKKLAELLSGHVTVSSVPGEGSRFKLSVAVRDAAQSSSSVSLDGLSLLHIHTGQSAEFAQKVRSLGATTYEYTDIQRAQAMLTNERVDVVTLCQQIDPAKACRFATMIREQEFEYRSLIVYFVAADHQLDELWLSSSGIDHWITFTNLHDVAQKLASWTDI